MRQGRGAWTRRPGSSWGRCISQSALPHLSLLRWRAPRHPPRERCIWHHHDSRQPLGGLRVHLIDASRRSTVAYELRRRFFVLPGEFEPVMIWASLSGYDADIDMESPIHKDGDCGFCHKPKEPEPAWSDLS